MSLQDQEPGAPGGAKVLFVDDDENVLDSFRRNLRGQFQVDTAPGGAQGLEAMAARGPYAVVVADMRMPGMDGIAFLQRARELAPDTVRIMLTGNADLATAQAAVNQGHVFLFLNKPCGQVELTGALEAAIRQHQLATAGKELLERTLSGCVQLLTEVLSVIDAPCFSRTGPTAELAERIALDLGAGDAWAVRVAAMLAPIGLITVPPQLLARFEAGEPLGDDERSLLQCFPETSAGLLGCIPRLEAVTEIVLYQGKNFDGTGFPEDGPGGDALPLGARILRAVPAFLALEEAYGSGESALEEMRQQEGAFDPRVLAALARIRAQELPGPARAVLARALAELRPGDLLAEPVCTLAGEGVAPAGTRLSQALLEKLLNCQSLAGLREPILVHAAE
jgi:response regulator RpfG family c-di-GMP phosphodiesterase